MAPGGDDEGGAGGAGASLGAPGTGGSPARSGNRNTGPRMPRVKLSAGVALPQSLPTGTAMGFSVDYAFETGTPPRNVRFLWVIQPSKGKAIEKAIRPRSKGTQRTFAKDSKPEQGPFECYFAAVVNGKKVPISAKVQLQSP